jgi:hypothetical protein
MLRLVDCGPVISLHKTQAQARKAACKRKHGRVLRLKTLRQWMLGTM